MKKIYISLLVCIASLCASTHVLADDVVTFTWKVSTWDYKTIRIAVTENKTYTVNWGDGDIQTLTGTGEINYQEHNYQDITSDHITVTITTSGSDANILKLDLNNLTSLNVSKAVKLTTLTCSNGSLSNLDISQNTLLTELDCTQNALKSLNISNNTNLERLYCQKNQLTQLDITNNSNLTNIRCTDNALPLSQLYQISEKINYIWYKTLGTQHWPTIKTALNTQVTITNELTLGGKTTQFAVEKLGSSAVENTDYTISSGKVTFKTNGVYIITATNEAIESSDLAKGITTCIAGTVENQQISFVWGEKAYQGSSTIELRATPGKEFTIDWGDKTIQKLTGRVDPFYLHSPYNDASGYTVTITGSEPDCLFSYVRINNSLQSLNTDKATALAELQIDECGLSAINLTNNRELTILGCSNNKLTALNVSNCPKLETLNCNGNQLTALDISSNTLLKGLNCDGNNLSLKTLYDLSMQITGFWYVNLGIQQWPSVTTALNVQHTITPDLLIDGKPTRFTVEKTDGTAVENTDYTLSSGKITFKTAGIYRVVMENEAIQYYAQAVAVYIAGSVPRQEISFSWNTIQGQEKQILLFTSIGKEYTINWGDGTIETYKGGYTAQNHNHTYEYSENVNVTITGVEPDCFFTTCIANGQKLTQINVKKATMLANLEISDNRITQLDLTANRKLIYLNCNKNLLTNLNLSNNTDLETISCENNQISTLTVNSSNRIKNLNCRNNRLTLAQIYEISNSTGTGLTFGTQYLPTKEVNINSWNVITTDLKFDNTDTRFIVSKNNNPAVEGTEYELTNGKILCLEDGIYTVRMENDAVSAYAGVEINYIVGYVPKQQLTFTWKATKNRLKEFTLFTTKGKQFSVDWGDGNTEQFTNNDDWTFNIAHTYAQDDSYNVKIMGEYADCSISTLSISYKRVTTLDISNATDINYLHCNGNFLPLSELYKITKQFPGAYVGTQSIGTKEAALNTATTITTETLFDGKQTQYAVYDIVETPAQPNIDYTLNANKITFKKKGVYVVVMTNEAIKSGNGNVAEVTQIYIAGTFEKQEMTFTWRGNTNRDNDIAIITTENKTYSINSGDGNTDTLTGTGFDSEQGVEHQYAENKDYTVKISGVDTNCLFFGLGIHETQTAALDISKVPTMVMLECSDNNLTTLDLTRNEMLAYLDCENNQLTKLDISKNTALQNLDCEYNYLPLSELNNIWKQLNNRADMDPQELPVVMTEINRPNTVTTELTIEGKNTLFAVYKNQEIATPDTDYTLNNGIITFKADGAYQVEMTNEAIDNGKVRVIARYQIGENVSVNQTQAETLNVYPNPVKEIINIEYTGENIQVQLYTLTGELLYTTFEKQINTASYRPGIYLLKTGSRVIKVVKQ